MRYLVTVLALLAFPSFAQVKLGLKLATNVALQYELVGAEISIQNNTSEVLDSSTNGNCKFSYVVRNQQGADVRKVSSPAHALIVRIPPGHTSTFADQPATQYDLSQLGAYTIQFRVELGDYTFTSENRYLDVVPGVEIASLAAKVSAGWRKYSARLLNRDKHDRLFLRIDDADLCYGVFDLGRVVRMSSNPDLRVDAQGLVHILHQTSPQQYAYNVFTPSGVRKEQQVLGSKETRIALNVNKSGDVTVGAVETQSQDGTRTLDSSPPGEEVRLNTAR